MRPGDQPPAPLLGGRLPGPDRLHVPRRQAPLGRPRAGRLRDRRVAFPVRGCDRDSILRPPEFLEDRRERELEIRASELRVRQFEENSCPNCEHPVERTYLRCPNCRARIKDPCESCGKPVDPRWSLCPYCETPTRRAELEPAATRRSGRRTASRPTRATRPVARSATDAGASPRRRARAASAHRPARRPASPLARPE